MMFADRDRLHIAIQKSGRLSESSRELLRGAGLRIQDGKNQLTARVANLPIDLMFVRDDDIPQAWPKSRATGRGSNCANAPHRAENAPTSP